MILLSVLFITGCAHRPSSEHDLIGLQVEVRTEPTIITTSSSSQVKENIFTGKLVSVIGDWVVFENRPGMLAINRNKVVSILAANSESSQK